MIYRSPRAFGLYFTNRLSQITLAIAKAKGNSKTKTVTITGINQIKLSSGNNQGRKSAKNTAVAVPKATVRA